MPSQPLPIENVLALLAATPGRIAAATAALPADRLHTAPHPGEWSANEVLAHLRACADVWGDCIRRILAEDKPTIRATNPRTWIQKTDYLDQEFRRSLEAFSAQRAGLLETLKPLQPEDWQRAATVTGAGKTLTRTAHFYADWLATHERPHIKQIERAANSLR